MIISFSIVSLLRGCLAITKSALPYFFLKFIKSQDDFINNQKKYIMMKYNILLSAAFIPASSATNKHEELRQSTTADIPRAIYDCLL